MTITIEEKVRLAERCVFRDYLREAAKRNILVYDSDTTKGTFSKRLGCMLVYTLEQNSEDPNDTQVDKIYLGADAIVDLSIERESMCVVCENGRPTHMYGAELVAHDFFDAGSNKITVGGEDYLVSDAVDFFVNENGSSLQCHDIGLVLAVTCGGQVMVGSY
jgi:hypothetical protein